MKKISTPKHKKKAKGTKDTPVVVLMWAALFGVTGYLLGRTILAAQPHPIHWLSGLLGILVGIAAGWAWYRWRGDVI